MLTKISIKEVLGNVEKLHNLTESKLDDVENKRFAALNELARKIRATLNALHYIPYEEYPVLCAPTNLLYRSLITDLMISLLISQIDDKQLDEVIYCFDREFAKSMKSALKANIEIRKITYPEDAEAFEEQRIRYQENLYDDLQDCFISAKGEDWKLQPQKTITINGNNFNGQLSQIYDILKSYKEVASYAYVYQFYRLFSQSEHFSIKGRIINHKQPFHEEYYNKVRWIIHFGTDFLYNKYVQS